MAMDEAPLSSEQALDDYFNSLLGIGDFSEDESECNTPSDMSSSENASGEIACTDNTADSEPSVDSTECHAGTDSTERQANALDTLHFDSAKEETCVEVAAIDRMEWQAQSSMHIEPSVHYGRDVDYDEPPNLQQLEKLFDGMRSQAEVDTPEVLQPLLQPELEQAALIQPELIQPEPEIQHWALPETDHVADSTSDVDAVTSESDRDLAVSEPEQNVSVDHAVETHQANFGGGDATAWQSTERSENFQVLYFAVNGMTFAVPLDELGGIHKMAELSHLIGRPTWYLGLQSSRESQVDVVDTAKWVMPDVLTDDEYKSNYEYIVMLGESNWGLASTELKGTEQLRPEAVRWREQSGKRPWLAGMVKEQMCALVHVSELIGMLNAGLDVNSVQ
ncbi:chemotaxis protein CheW [Vibrio nomapromontoriensis]|uniref:chemotaxis protein CheW n=1 Tax=Vibrio nomapromontoriensis TaxID=2910246 RepID=UPI003D146B11